jgi:hypothetical protein
VYRLAGEVVALNEKKLAAVRDSAYTHKN